MKVYFAPKFGNLFMGVASRNKMGYTLWGCKVKKDETPYEAITKYLVGKRVEYVDRKPFIDTDQVKVFSGKAEWTANVNVALTLEMVTACLIE